MDDFQILPPNSGSPDFRKKKCPLIPPFLTTIFVHLPHVIQPKELMTCLVKYVVEKTFDGVHNQELNKSLLESVSFSDFELFTFEIFDVFSTDHFIQKEMRSQHKGEICNHKQPK